MTNYILIIVLMTDSWFKAIRDGDIDYVRENMIKFKCITDDNYFTGLMVACCCFSDRHF